MRQKRGTPTSNAAQPEVQFTGQVPIVRSSHRLSVLLGGLALVGAAHFLSETTSWKETPRSNLNAGTYQAPVSVVSEAEPAILAVRTAARAATILAAELAAKKPIPARAPPAPTLADKPPPQSVALVANLPLSLGRVAPSATKRCVPGCEAHGNCNRELGRCDCPPLTTGPTCDAGIVPSCRKLWGFNLPAPPCQAWTSESDDWRDFPATCECLAECHALNHRLAYVGDCVNVSQVRPGPVKDFCPTSVQRVSCERAAAPHFPHRLACMLSVATEPRFDPHLGRSL